MTLFDASSLIAAAIEATGSEDFGGSTFREGLERLCDSLATEAELTEMGETILEIRLRSLLVNRLRIERTYGEHPEIDDQQIDGPVFIVGLPRTGTTALSQLLALDPQIRSLRLWESSEPVPAPETATEHSDARIAENERSLETMYSVFPRMKALYFQTATGPTECQDLLGMEMRTSHFDGMAHVPSYTAWVMDCDMAPAYDYHRRTLQLLQWHCPPTLWHLKTPVHLLSLGEVVRVYPGARFLWTHRDPAEVMGSVCSLISYTRSWVSDRDESPDIGAEQLSIWSEAVSRGMAFRAQVGEERFADVAFGELNADPVGTVAAAYDRIGLSLGDDARRLIGAWAAEHSRGSHGAHEYALDGFGLTPAAVHERFAAYLERFPAPAP
ncbi:MAG TPA: sulfotransferase [Acidimicrobiales bacterium]|nr:sulfotransferase [Acidimicrobiales bacterium]